MQKDFLNAFILVIIITKAGNIQIRKWTFSRPGKLI
jgi:hypothetical protein